MSNYHGVLNKDYQGQKTTAIPVNGVDNPTTAPTLALVANANSTLVAATYYVAYSWVNANGETRISSEASIAVTTGNDISVTLPAFPTNATKAFVYISQTSGSQVKQGETATTSYTQSTALVTGDAPAIYNTTFDWVTPITLGGSLPAGTNNIGDVDVLSLPTLPAGTNTIGSVGVASNSSVILASAARTAGASTASIDVAAYDKAVVFLDVTAASGTSPTLDVKVEGYDPASAKWVTITSFTQATAVGTQRVTVADLFESSIRVTYALGGTSPSFTFSVGAVLKS